MSYSPEQLERMVTVLTDINSKQHAEIARCHDRINELLKSNNEFEERARRAERQAKAPFEYEEAIEMADDLYTSVKAIRGLTSELSTEVSNYEVARRDLSKALAKHRT